MRPVALIKELGIEITLRRSIWSLPINPMLRGWTELFRIGSNKGVDERQVKWVRTQPESIEGTRQSARRMVGCILRGKDSESADGEDDRR
jgi:hypothetical protein